MKKSNTIRSELIILYKFIKALRIGMLRNTAGSDKVKHAMCFVGSKLFWAKKYASKKEHVFTGNAS